VIGQFLMAYYIYCRPGLKQLEKYRCVTGLNRGHDMAALISTVEGV